MTKRDLADIDKELNALGKVPDHLANILASYDYPKNDLEELDRLLDGLTDGVSVYDSNVAAPTPSRPVIQSMLFSPPLGREQRVTEDIEEVHSDAAETGAPVEEIIEGDAESDVAEDQEDEVVILDSGEEGIEEDIEDAFETIGSEPEVASAADEKVAGNTDTGVEASQEGAGLLDVEAEIDQNAVKEAVGAIEEMGDRQETDILRGMDSTAGMIGSDLSLSVTPSMDTAVGGATLTEKDGAAGAIEEPKEGISEDSGAIEKKERDPHSMDPTGMDQPAGEAVKSLQEMALSMESIQGSGGEDAAVPEDVDDAEKVLESELSEIEDIDVGEADALSFAVSPDDIDQGINLERDQSEPVLEPNRSERPRDVFRDSEYRRLLELELDPDEFPQSEPPSAMPEDEEIELLDDEDIVELDEEELEMDSVTRQMDLEPESSDS